MKAFIAFFLCLVCGLCSAAESETFCNWDHPGSNKYQGPPVEALKDYYMDYRVRATLQVKMINHWYDDVVEIRRDGVYSSTGTYSNMRDMHYGKGSYCPGPVDTRGWPTAQVERGLVYCVDAVCVIVPTVCNNVSLIDRSSEEPLEISPSAGNRTTSGDSQPGLNPGAGEPGSISGSTDDQSVPGTSAPETGAEEGPGSGVPSFVVPGSGGNDGSIIVPGRSTSSPSCGRASNLACGFVGPIGPGHPVPPITPVPEPAEWVMILAGIGCFVFMWSRRRK